jgi:hypothetical protein
VALDCVTAVEFVEESAFNLPHTFQIVYHSKKTGFVILYVTATDSAECSDWVATLRQACYFNKDMSMHYHPGALLKNSWSCCQQNGKTSLGCQPTYHLLTRSSSRYAQMRRKDTLSSNHSSRGRSKSGSLQRGERASLSPDTCCEHRASRKGLSNSCCDLTHKQVRNRFEPEVQEVESRRSSQLSAGPSVSMGCITLTHLSLPESIPPPSPSTPSIDPTTKTEESPGRHPIMRAEGRKKSRRFQVSPENSAGSAPRITFPSSESQPHLACKSITYPALPNRFTHSVSAHFTTHNVQPTVSLTHSTDSSQVPANEGSYHCLTEPRKSRRSKSYLATPSLQQNQLTASSNLVPPKPVLEPKVSVTDPNTIHV